MAPNDPLVGNLLPDGTPPPGRLKDPASAHAIYLRLKQADDINARNRAEVDTMFDGAPPYDDNILREAGMASRCNLNFGEAEFLLESALAGYIDLINSVETLVRVSVKEQNPINKSDWEQIISEGFSRMLRSDSEFSFKHILNCTYFIKHGVSIAYFDDEYDWRWQVAKIGDFLLPRRTFASEESIEVAVSPRTVRGHELYQFIKNPERAEEIGWNIEEVKKAIIANTGTQQSYTLTDWERYEEDLKNNDIFVAHGAGSEVRILHFWVKEFDGTISHYISLADGSNKEFLYQKRGRYKKACDAFVTFTYGVGTNGFYQSIRGLGYKIFPHIQISNRLRCQGVDCAMLSSSVLIQPQTEDDLENLSFSYLGPFSVLNAGAVLVDKELPDMGKSTLPILADMAEQLQKRSGAYQTTAANPSSTERTKFEVQAQLQGEARLSTGAMNLFYEPWNRLLRTSFFRAICDKYLSSDAGGEQVMEFRKYCTSRGVPLEVLLNKIEDVVAVRAIGAGSDQLRLVAMDEFVQIMGQFDEEGRQNLIRDRVAARVGYDHVDRYVPTKPNSRPVIDEKIAELENAAFSQGRQINPQDNENHYIHASVHIPDIAHVGDAVKQGQIDPHQAAEYFQLAIPHATAHMEKVALDNSRKEEYGQLKKLLQQSSEIAEQTIEKVQAQASQPQAGGQPQTQPPSPETSLKLKQAEEAHNAAMQREQELHQQKLQLEAADHQQKAGIKDAETAVKLKKLAESTPSQKESPTV
jgi:hypothetical protein